jgi:hypothetical protein
LEVYIRPTGMDFIFLVKVFEQNVEFLNYNRRGNGISEKKILPYLFAQKINFALAPLTVKELC